jgi:cold shock CspA family protein
MRQIKIDYRPPAGRGSGRGSRPPQARQRSKTPRCPQHPGVHMVLAGSNPRWNTIRYLCPMCDAMGQPPVEIATGVVSGYWPQRGYGFIDNGGPRIFFHVSDLARGTQPYVGMPVTCQVAQNERGLIGRQVRAR